MDSGLARGRTGQHPEMPHSAWIGDVLTCREARVAADSPASGSDTPPTARCRLTRVDRLTELASHANLWPISDTITSDITAGQYNETDKNRSHLSKERSVRVVKHCGAEGNRTPDPRLAKLLVDAT